MNSRTWLKDHVTTIIAILIAVSWVVVDMLVLLKEVHSDDKVTFLILANSYGALSFILGYYFAASKRPTHADPSSPLTTNQTTSHEKQDN